MKLHNIWVRLVVTELIWVSLCETGQRSRGWSTGWRNPWSMLLMKFPSSFFFHDCNTVWDNLPFVRLCSLRFGMEQGRYEWWPKDRYRCIWVYRFLNTISLWLRINKFQSLILYLFFSIFYLICVCGCFVKIATFVCSIKLRFKTCMFWSFIKTFVL